MAKDEKKPDITDKSKGKEPVRNVDGFNGLKPADKKAQDGENGKKITDLPPGMFE